MATSNTPPIVFIKEAVDDLAEYLDMWTGRTPTADTTAARAAGSMAMGRINAIAGYLSDMSQQLQAELQAFDDGVRAAGDPLLNVRRDDRPYDPRD